MASSKPVTRSQLTTHKDGSVQHHPLKAANSLKKNSVAAVPQQAISKHEKEETLRKFDTPITVTVVFN